MYFRSWYQPPPPPTHTHKHYLSVPYLTALHLITVSISDNNLTNHLSRKGLLFRQPKRLGVLGQSILVSLEI